MIEDNDGITPAHLKGVTETVLAHVKWGKLNESKINSVCRRIEMEPMRLIGGVGIMVAFSRIKKKNIENVVKPRLEHYIEWSNSIDPLRTINEVDDELCNYSAVFENISHFSVIKTLFNYSLKKLYTYALFKIMQHLTDEEIISQLSKKLTWRRGQGTVAHILVYTGVLDDLIYNYWDKSSETLKNGILNITDNYGYSIFDTIGDQRF